MRGFPFSCTLKMQKKIEPSDYRKMEDVVPTGQHGEIIR